MPPSWQLGQAEDQRQLCQPAQPRPGGLRDRSQPQRPWVVALVAGTIAALSPGLARALESPRVGSIDSGAAIATRPSPIASPMTRPILGPIASPISRPIDSPRGSIAGSSPEAITPEAARSLDPIASPLPSAIAAPTSTATQFPIRAEIGAETVFPGQASQGQASQGQAGQVGQVGQLTEGPCRFFQPEGAKIPAASLRCGLVTVPEHHDQPNGKLIRVGVAVLKSTSANPAPDPLVIIQGGPGGSAIELIPSFAPLLAKAGLRDRDVIFFDQRGTRFAEPFLFCEELYNFKVQHAKDPDSEDLRAAYRQETRRCYDRFTSQGIDLSAYNSLDNAADLPVALTALGYRGPYNLYGVSYGSAFAQHLMRDHPDQIRSVVLDAVVPLDVSFVEQIPQNADRALKRFFANCQSDRRCQATYPNLAEDFKAAIVRLNEKPETVTLPNLGALQAALEDGAKPQNLDSSKFLVPVWVNGDSLLSAFNATFYSSDSLPKLAQAIQEAKAGNYALAMQIVPVLLFNRSEAEGMYNSVVCSEDGRFSLDQVSVAGIDPVIAKALRDGPAEMLKSCQQWPVPPIADRGNQLVKSDIPTLLLSGELDQIAPPMFADRVAAGLTNSYRFTFPGMGHAVIGSGDCPASVMAAFLRNPNQAPDASCIQNMALKFDLPAPIATQPVQENTLKFRTVMPRGWERQIGLPLPAWGEQKDGQPTGRSALLLPAIGLNPETLLASFPQKLKAVADRRWGNRTWRIYVTENTAVASLVALSRRASGDPYEMMIAIDSDSVWHRDAVLEAIASQLQFTR